MPREAYGVCQCAPLVAVLVATAGARCRPEDSISFTQVLLESAVKVTKTDPVVQPADEYRIDFPSDGLTPRAPTSDTSNSTNSSPVTAMPGGADQDWFSMRAVVAEYLAMTLFVTIGCGCAMAIAREEGSAWVLQVSLAFGFAITALAFAFGRYSGGQINCAVTLALLVVGKLGWWQSVCNWVAQILGSITGAIILCMIFPKEMDHTGVLGSNIINEGFSSFQALLGETVMTFVLVFVVLESCTVTGATAGLSVLAIGLAVFVAHTVLVPVDGCCINPTRSIGPALVAAMRKEQAGTFRHMWVFWLGPIAGTLIAAGVHTLFQT